MAQTDVIVVGAGMAGLVAAVRAQQLGAKVTLLEKGPAPGGSLGLSGGTLWCARTVDDLRRLVPRGHPTLGPRLVEDFPGGVEWLRSLGAVLTPLDSKPDRFVYLMDPNPGVFIAGLIATFVEGGGTLLTETSAVSLRINDAGSITGVTVRPGDGARYELDAPVVILASGGFLANPELKARYFGRWSDRLIVRGNPHSTGDGWAMAQAIGAGSSAAMSSFYGHLMPAPPARVPTNDFIAYTQYHSEKGVLVNREGVRFTDESLGDETNAQAVAQQNEAVGYLIFDDAVYREFAVREGGKGARASDTFFESQALGAPAATANSLEELAQAMQPHGLYAPGLIATLSAYNDAVTAGAAAHLPIPRRDLTYPVTNPPFYALGVTPGVTFTLGGLPINEDAQVLDRSGHPLPGLYAAGADAGGIHNEQYAGGLCLGLVFGRRAAQHAFGG
ncbi:MAG: FAD-dependent oxidoreductase [Thermomicrobiales bacterium]|nr:FAD-dependent oxidoreductase [Thermomicrobiales bacterium]